MARSAHLLHALLAAVLLVACAQPIQQFEGADVGLDAGADAEATALPDAAQEGLDASQGADVGAPLHCADAGCSSFNFCDRPSGRCQTGCAKSADCAGGTCESDHLHLPQGLPQVRRPLRR